MAKEELQRLFSDIYQHTSSGPAAMLLQAMDLSIEELRVELETAAPTRVPELQGAIREMRRFCKRARSGKDQLVAAASRPPGKRGL